MKSAKRVYRQTARAEAAEQTRERILDAFERLVFERDLDDITLDEIAEAAGVTLQTVLRKFGSKEDLFAIGVSERGSKVMEQRKPATPDARAAVKALVASYEKIGGLNWRMLRHEENRPALRELLDGARALHRTWVGESFAAMLPATGPERARLIDALFTVLDFYVWKLQRKDLGRSRAETETLMLGLVEAVLEKRRSA